jgi:hypothetical protein
MLPQEYYDYALRRESGGNPLARNPRSSATGLYQFTTGTWDDLRQKYPHLALTAYGRLDPAQQERAMKQFTEDNAGLLKNKGYEVNSDNLYLAHRFGPQGALQLLQSDPNAPVANVVSPAVMQANPDLNGKTVAQLTQARAQAPVANKAPPMQPMQPPALSSTAVMGPGALQDQRPGFDPSTTMQQAGAWLMAINDPKALGALGALQKTNEGNYSLVQGQDGSMYRVNKRNGAVERVGAQNPNRPTTPGQKKVDEEYAKEYSDWSANGGYSSVQENVSRLQGIVKQLRETPDGTVTGGWKHFAPETALAAVDPNALASEQGAHSIIQGSIRQILGPQFTQKEGEGVMARLYDRRLSQKENADRLERFTEQLITQGKSKDDAAQYFEKNGSLTGWTGKRAQWNDFDPLNKPKAEPKTQQTPTSGRRSLSDIFK